MRFMKKVRLHPLVVFQKHGWSRTHGWAKVSQRFDRRAMAIDRTFVAPAQPCWSAAADLPTADHECYFVCESHRLPVAATAQRFSELENGVPSLLALAVVGPVAGNSRCAAPATASCRGKKAHSQCRDHRQPKRENHGSRRNSGLRCRQKGQPAASGISWSILWD